MESNSLFLRDMPLYPLEIPGYYTVLLFKRNTIRSGGVAMYEKENMDTWEEWQSIENDLFKFNQDNMNVKRISIFHADIGDICSVETTINSKRTVLVSVYNYPNTSLIEY